MMFFFSKLTKHFHVNGYGFIGCSFGAFTLAIGFTTWSALPSAWADHSKKKGQTQGEAQRGRSCQNVLSKSRISVASLFPDVEYEVFKGSHGEKIQVAQDALRRESVNFSIEKSKNKPWRDVLVISNQGNAYFNRLAGSLDRVYGARLVFDPHKLKGAVAMQVGKFIYISESSVSVGYPDWALFHEIRHLAMQRHEQTSQTPLANGFVLDPFEASPWGKAGLLGSAYLHEIDFQEQKTFRQDLRYHVRASARHLQHTNPSELEIFKDMEEISRQATYVRLIQEHLRNIVDYEIEKYKKGAGFVLFNQSRNRVHLALLRPFFYVSHLVPNFILDQLAPGTSEQRAQLFKGHDGRKLLQKIALEYLRQLREDIEIDLAETRSFEPAEKLFTVFRMRRVMDYDLANMTPPELSGGDLHEFLKESILSKLRPVSQSETPSSRNSQ